MKRLGTIDELGALCAFLCSRQASYITGQSIVIDGGKVPALLWYVLGVLVTASSYMVEDSEAGVCGAEKLAKCHTGKCNLVKAGHLV